MISYKEGMQGKSTREQDLDPKWMRMGNGESLKRNFIVCTVHLI
jgi:hypothetical protein